MSSDAATYFDRLRPHLRLGDAAERELVRELAAHVDDRVAAKVRAGMPEERARHLALESLGRPRTLAHLVRQAELRATRSEAAAAAIPFLIAGAVVGAKLWQFPLVAAAVSALVIAVTLYGLWLGRPAWFYPWAGVALTMPLVAGYLAFAVLHRSLPDVLHGRANPLALAGVTGAALYFAVGFVVVAASIIVAIRRDWLDASVLLSPLPVAFAWIIEVHRAGGLTSGGGDGAVYALLGAIYVCMALAMVAFLLSNTRNLKCTVLVGTAIVLLSAATLAIDPAQGLMPLAGRGLVLVGFLLSPAVIARQAARLSV